MHRLANRGLQLPQGGRVAVHVMAASSRIDCSTLAAVRSNSASISLLPAASCIDELPTAVEISSLRSALQPAGGEATRARRWRSRRRP